MRRKHNIEGLCIYSTDKYQVVLLQAQHQKSMKIKALYQCTDTGDIKNNSMIVDLSLFI